MKKFILKCLYTVFPVMVIIYACGFYVNFYLVKVLPKAGDLGQLGYFYIDKAPYLLDPKLSENKVDTYYNHTKIEKSYEIMTIGDSFSQQGNGGYQNYLAAKLGDRILNYPDPGDGKYSPEERALYLLNNDVYAQLGCKTVIVETVERDFVQRILGFRDVKHLECDSDCKKKETTMEETKKRDYLMETFKYIKYHLYKSKRPVREVQLNEDCFSVPPYNILYFYKYDLRKLSITSEESKAVLDKLNYLHNRFSEKGIDLYYIIAPDKYDVYQPYIKDNPYPPKTVIEQLEKNGIERLEWFINPRDGFRRMLSGGVKDLYSVDDTHWSYKASEYVGCTVAKKLMGNVSNE